MRPSNRAVPPSIPVPVRFSFGRCTNRSASAFLVALSTIQGAKIAGPNSDWGKLDSGKSSPSHRRRTGECAAFLARLRRYGGEPSGEATSEWRAGFATIPLPLSGLK
ncbi:hypothetical protein Tco_0503097 [Tanacetum coccineum]